MLGVCAVHLESMYHCEPLNWDLGDMEVKESENRRPILSMLSRAIRAATTIAVVLLVCVFAAMAQDESAAGPALSPVTGPTPEISAPAKPAAKPVDADPSNGTPKARLRDLVPAELDVLDQSECGPETAESECSNAEGEPVRSVKRGFKMKEAMIQSSLMLAVQHGFRMFQHKTYTELDGPFFRDWGKSVKGLQGWRDGDNGFINYFAHPMQGATTSRIFLTNSPGANQIPFGKSGKYWKTRMQALAWSALWSTQFELGPVSEANIGNVGLRKKNGVSTMGWVDLVMTPTAGTGIVIAEDAVERYVLRKFERNIVGGKTPTKLKILRSLLTPTYSVNNLLRGKTPWHRDDVVWPVNARVEH